MDIQTRRCPYCAEEIQVEAKKCKHCGEFLDESLKKTNAPIIQNETTPESKHSAGTAGVLSFFIPGLGQLYKGHLLNGIIWFFSVALGYALFIVPGILIHIFCIINALKKDGEVKKVAEHFEM